ncbi:MAG: hypothetical protein HOB37_01660 [Rhodospirillaceae bacterium]|nr:hypothetical protein [Rhodospirillaceae bacterium]
MTNARGHDAPKASAPRPRRLAEWLDGIGESAPQDARGPEVDNSQDIEIKPVV